MNRRRIAALAGVVGPAVFVATFTAEGLLRPGYDPLRMYISALSLGQRGWIQIANFIVLGVLLFVFARGVAAEFTAGKASRGGLLLLTLLSLLFMVSGPFVMDPEGTPPSQATIHGTIHGIAGGLVFLLMPITCIVYLRRFRADGNWQLLRRWTLVLGTIEVVGVLVFTIVSKSPVLAPAFENWLGLIQRVALVPFMLWLFVFALELLKRSERG